jgi:hypothetical protein
LCWSAAMLQALRALRGHFQPCAYSARTGAADDRPRRAQPRQQPAFAQAPGRGTQAGRRGQLNRTREHHGSRRYPDHDRGQPRRRPPAPVYPARQPTATFRVASTRGTSTRATFAKSLQHGMRVISRPLRQRSYETGEGEKRTVYEVDADDVAVPLRGRRSRSPRRHAQLPVPPNPPGIPTRGRVKARKVTQALRLSSPPSTESCRCFPRSVRLHYTGMPAVRVTILKYEVCRHGRGNLREAYRRIGDPASDAGRHHPPGRGMPL